MRISLASAVFTVALVACDRGIAPTSRAMVARGLPTCSARETYQRPVVVRVDRDRSLFDEAFTAHEVAYAPQPSVSIVVPRTRMRATLRVGTCAPTSLGTWDCNAATWLASTPIELDARSGQAEVTLPPVTAPCAPQR